MPGPVEDCEGRLRTVAIALVLVVWGLNMILDAVLNEGYDPSPFVHGAMMLVLGRLMGIKVGGR